MSAARGLSLVEILVATCVLSVGLVAILTGLRYATESIEAGRSETTAVFLAEERLEPLRSLALADWNHALLAAGTTREEYGAIVGAPRFRRETTVWDRADALCAGTAPATVTCKTVRVAVAYRAGSGRERDVGLATVLAPRP